MKRESKDKPKRIRCFIGIAYKPSPALRDLTRTLEELAADDSTHLRLIPEENLHITLKFLGSVEQTQLAVIENTVQQIAARHGPLQITLKGIGYFKNSIWIGAERSPELLELVAELNLAFATLGIRPVEKAYVPHVTVARHKNKAKISLSSLTEKFSAHPWGKLLTPSIVLYHSDTLPDGAKYNVLADFKLART